MAILDWLLILSSDRKCIIISPCDQNVCLPADFSNNYKTTCGVAQSKGLAQSKKMNKAVPLVWLLQLHFKMFHFIQVWAKMVLDNLGKEASIF